MCALKFMIVSLVARVQEIPPPPPIRIGLMKGFLKFSPVTANAAYSLDTLASKLGLEHDGAQQKTCSHYTADSSYSRVTLGLVFT